MTGVMASLTGRTLTAWRVWPVKLSSTILELGCKKSVRVRYVIVLGFTECRGVRLLAIGL